MFHPPSGTNERAQIAGTQTVEVVAERAPEPKTALTPENRPPRLRRFEVRQYVIAPDSSLLVQFTDAAELYFVSVMSGASTARVNVYMGSTAAGVYFELGPNGRVQWPSGGSTQFTLANRDSNAVTVVVVARDEKTPFEYLRSVT